jgi:hypothetical protein
MKNLKDLIDRLSKKADFTTNILKGQIADYLTWANRDGYNQALEDVIAKISDAKTIEMIKGLKKD